MPYYPKRSQASRCIIAGCGGHGRVVLDILRNAGGCQVVGFVDSDRSLVGRRIDGIKVLGHPDDLPALRSAFGIEAGIVAVGHNGARGALAGDLEQAGLRLVNAVHPSANLAQNVVLGRNIVIAAGSLVCAHCQIGDSVILNTGSIVDHESIIGEATHICPGARLAGRVTVEPGAFVGIGATVTQSLRIGRESIIGAGAVVIRDVAPKTTVVGVPARELGAVYKQAEMHVWQVPEVASQHTLVGPAVTTAL